MTETTDWSFLRRPVWLAGHVLAVGAVVVFVMASMWQFDRRQQRDALDAEIETALAAPVTPLGMLIDQDPESIRFRTVTVTGRFHADAEVILVLQTLDGVSGHRVLTPLTTDELGRYTEIVVDRGWVPAQLDQPDDERFAPPGGEVEVTGMVRTTQLRGRHVPPEGLLTQIGRVDLDRLQRQIDGELAPVFLHMTAPGPATADGLPVPAPLPLLDARAPHLSYAIQWAVFAAVTVVGYGVLLRRTARSPAA